MENEPEPRAAKSKAFFYARVAVLLSILVFVVVFAAYDTWSRRRRNRWDHTLEVALVVLREEGAPAAAIAAMRERVPALEARLASELQKRKPGAPPPFHISFFGPVEGVVSPTLPTSDSPFERASEMYAQWRALAAIDEKAEVHARAFDSRIYVTVRQAASTERRWVEGASEEGGRVGTVSVEIASDTVDLALIVSAHELFHTLGATDKYDAAGHTMIPEGLAEPDAVPTYPQRLAEVMARYRVLAAGSEKIPSRLDELGVGPGTAREIGWLDR